MGKHDDQVDSTAQFLDWYKKPFPSQGHYEYMRQRAQELQQRDKPQPTKTVWAIGSMVQPASAPLSLAANRATRATTELTVAGDRWFESISLQRRVNCEPDFLRFRQVSAKPTNPADDRQPVERR